MGLIENLMARRGQLVEWWGQRLDETADAGIADPAWINVGSTSVIISELAPMEAETLAGGPVETKLATLMCTAADGVLIKVGDLLVTAAGEIWKVDGAPSQPRTGGHYEARLAVEPSPPAELLQEET